MSHAGVTSITCLGSTICGLVIVAISDSPLFDGFGWGLCVEASLVIIITLIAGRNSKEGPNE